MSRGTRRSSGQFAALQPSDTDFQEEVPARLTSKADAVSSQEERQEEEHQVDDATRDDAEIPVADRVKDGSISVAINVPLAADDNGSSATKHFHLQLNQTQAVSVRRLFKHLNQHHLLRNNGRHVDSTNHALLWLIDQIDQKK